MVVSTRKELLRKLAKKNIDFLREICIIEDNHTGRVIIEMNLNQGSLTNVKVTPEIHG